MHNIIYGGLMSSITSNAYNLSSFSSSGVDNRTGMYTMSINLGEFLSHKGAGVSIPLNINYDPSNAIDTGFGRGWSLNLSYFDKSNNNLKLSTGQSFKIHWNDATNEYDILYRGLRDLRVFYLSETSEIKILYKDGKHEYLSFEDGILTKIVTPQGLEINFEYDMYRGRQVLWSINDGNRKIDIDWWSDDYQTVVSNVFNNISIYNFTFYKYDSDHTLRYVSTPLMDDFISIEYELFSDINYKVISKVTNPSGKVEEIEYRNGHSLPIGAPISIIPYVYKHTLLASEHQSEKITIYHYSDKNYLGFGSDRKWIHGEDTLFKATSNYIYSTEEVINETKKITRIYNKYHLLEKECFFDKNIQYKEIDYQYYANLNYGIEYQPAQYSLLKLKSTRYISDAIVNIVVIVTEYDEYANVIKEVFSDGTTIERDFYSINGEQGSCPVSPTGIVSLIKEERLIPHDKSKNKVKKYEYQSIPALNNYGFFVVLKNELVDNERYECQYYVNSEKTDEYGRIRSTKNIFNSYESMIEYTYEFANNNFKISEVTTTFDGKCLSVLRKFDYLNLKLLEFVDEALNVKRFCYDVIGRLISEKFRPDTLYETYANYTYNSSNNNNYILKDSFNGNVEKCDFNNNGNLIRISVQQVGCDLKVIQEQWYDKFGFISKKDEIDWFGEKSIRLIQSYKYNSYGEICLIVHGDGRQEEIIQDPSTMTVIYRQVGLLSEKSIYNLSGQIIEKETKNNNDILLARTAYSYDSNGNVTSITDTNNRKTTFKHDLYHRVTEVRRDVEGTAIIEKYEYAKFSKQSLISHITVNEKQIGVKNYDGLMRVISETSTSGTINYQYSGISQLPTGLITAVNDIINVTLEPVLQLPTSIVVEGEPKLSSIFHYDKKLSTATSNLNENSRNEMDLDSFGRVIENRVSLNDGIDRVSQTTLSLSGRVMAESDYFGNKKSYEYDDFGRLSSISENITGNKNTHTNIYYDTYSRPKRYELYDRGCFIELNVEYNAIGLETFREVNVDSLSIFSITQDYNSSLLVERRVHHDELGFTIENYEYDDLGRLTDFLCTGVDGPIDDYGKKINHQTYEYNMYGNVTASASYFVDGSNISRYTYSDGDPMRMESIKSSHPDYPNVMFSYDKAGNMLVDEIGRHYQYDALGRVNKVSDSNHNVLSMYAYDAKGKLVSQSYNNFITYMMYLHEKLSNEVCNNESSSYSRHTVGLTTRHVAGDSQIILGNAQNSTMRTVTISNNRMGVSSAIHYPPYGK